MKATSPYKINLGLHITHRLEDGFHAIETVFYPMNNLHDTIEITPTSNFLFTMEGGDFNCPTEHNLCVKAYKLLQKIYKLPPVHIHLDKKIPSGAGVGGGSADAATTLKLLNTLFNLHLTPENLKTIACQLGSDVPFFIENIPALGIHKGEVLQPIPLDLSAYHISVFKPDFSIATAQAYRYVHPQSGRPSPAVLIRQPINQWKNILYNDFEKNLFSTYPLLQDIKCKFYELGAIYASLSGSGSAIFAIGHHPIPLKNYFQGQDF